MMPSGESMSLIIIDKHRALFTYAHDCMLVADWLTEYGSAGPFNLKARHPEFASVGAFDSEVEQNVEFEIDKAVSRAKIGPGESPPIAYPVG